MPKSTLKLLIVIFISFLFTIIFSWGVFRNSYYYTEYQMTLALKYGDNVKFMKYIETDKILDNFISTILTDYSSVANGQEYLLAASIINNMKPYLENQIEQYIHDTYTTDTEFLKNENNIAILFKILTNKVPANGNNIKYTKLTPDKINKEIICKEQSCDISEIYQKINGTWKLVGFIFPEGYFRYALK